MSSKKNRHILNEKGASLIEYALIAALFVIGLIAVMPSTEKSVACRVNTAKSQYTNYDISDPSSSSSGKIKSCD